MGGENRKSVAEEDDEEGYDDEKSEHGRMGKRRGRRILQTMDTGKRLLLNILQIPIFDIH